MTNMEVHFVSIGLTYIQALNRILLKVKIRLTGGVEIKTIIDSTVSDLPRHKTDSDILKDTRVIQNFKHRQVV